MAVPSGPTQPLRFNKTIVNLPSVLTPDSIFAVRKGAGIELYVSDMTGSIAYKSNSPISVGLLSANTVASVTTLSFDPASGFLVTDLGGGQALISGTTGPTGSQGIQGNIGATGSQGIQGNIGTQGNKGDTGSFGGAAFDYMYTAATDPLSGEFAFNNVDFTLVTTMYITNTDENGVTTTNFIETIDDSTSLIKGHFSIVNHDTPAASTMFAIIGNHVLTDNVYAVPVSWLSGPAFLVDGSANILTFARTGDKGDTGSQGIQGFASDVTLISSAARLIQTQRIMAQMVARGQI